MLRPQRLDVKLALRMLVKHPVLTLIAAVATSFVIGGGAVYFEVVNDFINPSFLSCAAPALRVLRIDPTDAIREL